MGLLRSFGRALRARLVFLVAASVLGLAPMAMAHENRRFESPEAAMNAFGEAVRSSDEAALKAMLGTEFRTLIPPVGADAVERFLRAWEEKHAIQDADDKSAHVAVGNDGWTLPIPLVKADKGWQFDTRAGAEEMRVRRIGRNELAVMQTLLAICDAQREYAAENHGGGVLKYATKLKSSPGKQDGLYWPTGPGERPSPLGPVPRRGAGARGPEGYHGYHFKLLTRQGPHAQRRRARLHGARQPVRRLRDRRLAGALLGHRRDELHGQPRGPDLRARPRAEQRGQGRGHDELRPGAGLAQGGTVRGLCGAALAGAALALAACTYYVMPNGTAVPAGSAYPRNFDRTFTAAATAMRDQGLAISVEDRARGTVVGTYDGGTVTANVRPQSDGSVRAQFDALQRARSGAAPAHLRQLRPAPRAVRPRLAGAGARTSRLVITTAAARRDPDARRRPFALAAVQLLQCNRARRRQRASKPEEPMSSFLERLVHALFRGPAETVDEADRPLVDDAIEAFVETVEPRVRLRFTPSLRYQHRNHLYRSTTRCRYDQLLHARLVAPGGRRVRASPPAAGVRSRPRGTAPLRRAFPR